MKKICKKNVVLTINDEELKCYLAKGFKEVKKVEVKTEVVIDKEEVAKAVFNEPKKNKRVE